MKRSAWLLLLLCTVPVYAGDDEKAGEEANEADEAKGKPASVRLLLETLPTFVFEDDRMPLSFRAGRVVGPPERRVRHWRGYDETTLAIRIGATDLPARPVRIPADFEQTETVIFEADFGPLGHDDELVFALAAPGEAPAIERVRILHVQHAFADTCHVNERQFFDKDGNRVIFMLPRADPSRQRRWLPLNELRRVTRASVAPMLLLGSRCGSGEYGRFFCARFGSGALYCPPEAPSVYHLLLSAFVARNDNPSVVIVYPGTCDIELGTPLRDFELALQAVCAVFERPGGGPAPAIVLATPPPYPAAPRQRETYAEAIADVARDRFAYLHETATPAVRRVMRGWEERYPGSLAQRLIGKDLVRTARLRRWPHPLVLGLVPFLLAALAWIWLCIVSRMRPRQERGAPNQKGP